MQSTFGLPGHADNGRCQRVNPFHINSFCKGLASRQTFFLPRLGITTDQLAGGDGPRPFTTEYPRWKQRSSAARGVTRACMRFIRARCDGVCCARTATRGGGVGSPLLGERCEHRDGGIGNASGSEPEDSRFEPWSLCSLAWPSSEGTRLQTATIGGASPSARSTPR
jgi:hypothetical protein